MKIIINDIIIILGLNLLGQETINTLSAEDIKRCFYKTVKLYHPDTNNLSDIRPLNDDLTKIINECYKEALNRIGELRKITSVEEDFISFNCHNYPNIYKPIISKFLTGKKDLLFLLRSLRVIDTGGIIPGFYII